MLTSTQTYWPDAVKTAFKRDLNLPVLSPVAIRVVQLSNDPVCDSRRLGETISADPGLSARVLKLANSSYYGFSGDIISVQQAIILIGFSAIRNLVLGLSMKDLFANCPETTYLDELWSHSYLTACLADTLVSYISCPHQCYTFTAGLLHNIGKLVIQSTYSKQTSAIIGASYSQNIPLHLVEEKVIGFNHAHVGGWAAKCWNLPTSLVETIALHHTPTKAKEASTLCAITSLSSFLARRKDETLPTDIPSVFLIPQISETMLVKMWEKWIPLRQTHLEAVGFLSAT